MERGGAPTGRNLTPDDRTTPSVPRVPPVVGVAGTPAWNSVPDAGAARHPVECSCRYVTPGTSRWGRRSQDNPIRPPATRWSRVVGGLSFVHMQLKRKRTGRKPARKYLPLTRQVARYLLPLIDRHDWGYQKKGTPVSSCTNEELGRFRRREFWPQKFTMTLLEPHLLGHKTYYYKSSRASGYCLVQVDVDAHQGQTDAALDAVELIASHFRGPTGSRARSCGGSTSTCSSTSAWSSGWSSTPSCQGSSPPCARSSSRTTSAARRRCWGGSRSSTRRAARSLTVPSPRSCHGLRRRTAPRC